MNRTFATLRKLLVFWRFPLAWAGSPCFTSPMSSNERGTEMTTTTRPGFTATREHGYTMSAPCYGRNHKDSAVIGTCDGCGWPVAKTHNGRILNMTYSDMGARRIACWSHGHECNAESAAAHTAQRAEKIAAGEIVKGATVTVVKGRKVAHGTTGTVTWIGEDSYGKARVGFRTADGESIFTAMSNVTATA